MVRLISKQAILQDYGTFGINYVFVQYSERNVCSEGRGSSQVNRNWKFFLW